MELFFAKPYRLLFVLCCPPRCLQRPFLVEWIEHIPVEAMQVFPGRRLFLVQVAKQFIKLPLKMGAPSLNMRTASHHGKLLERNLNVLATLLCLVGCPNPKPLSFFYRG